MCMADQSSFLATLPGEPLDFYAISEEYTGKEAGSCNNHIALELLKEDAKVIRANLKRKEDVLSVLSTMNAVGYAQSMH